VKLHPLITIGLPVYNAMPYLPEAIDSLLAQTCPRFEILAIVDGATDSSLEYLRSVPDARLRILTQRNRGVANTLNRLLEECRTPWLVRHDADDVSHPQRIERLLLAITSAPHAGMFYSLANYHPRGRAVGTFRSSRGTPKELRNIVRQGYLLSICHPTVALNVEKTLRLGGYQVGLHNEDSDLWWRMALEHEIHCVAEELIGFRQNESSVSSHNLGPQMVAGLYVQYLLLSCLMGRAPQSFAAVRSALDAMLSPAMIRAKAHLREFNIRLGQKSYLRASRAIARTAATSPGYLISRMRDELLASRRERPVVNGLHPARFFERAEALWL
jgi:glycosyltransferase involved in cell wall biosynthesis